LQKNIIKKWQKSLEKAAIMNHENCGFFSVPYNLSFKKRVFFFYKNLAPFFPKPLLLVWDREGLS